MRYLMMDLENKSRLHDAEVLNKRNGRFMCGKDKWNSLPASRRRGISGDRSRYRGLNVGRERPEDECHDGSR
jgi:hypothetical protein